jgi:Mor family transcriptional regulator
MEKYVNAREVLPESLIKEIQKYVKGQHLYIPQTKRESWGTSTGIREELIQRNEKIYKLYNGGITTIELADMFSLSEERIRNIIFEMNRD